MGIEAGYMLSKVLQAKKEINAGQIHEVIWDQAGKAVHLATILCFSELHLHQTSFTAKRQWG